MIDSFPEIKIIPDIINGQNPSTLGIKKLKKNKLCDSKAIHDAWSYNLKITVDLLNKRNVNYVLIKSIDLPYAVMNDIDLLIEFPQDVSLFKKILREKNFIIQRRSMSKSDKVTALGSFDNSLAEIDVYTDPEWWKIDYAPHGLISSKKIAKEISGVFVNVPPPTIDLFILMTHSYWHGRITLSEVSQVIKLSLMKKINWSFLIGMAKRYHLAHPIFLYLTIINDVYGLIGHVDNELCSCLSILSKNYLNRLIITSVKKHNKCFPLYIPYIFKLVSSADEIISSWNAKHIRYKEGQSYFLCLLLCRQVENI